MSHRKNLVPWALTAGVARTADEMAGPALLLTILSTTGQARSAGLCVGAMTLATGVAGPLVGARLDSSESPKRLTAASMGLMASAMIGVGWASTTSTLLVLLLAILAGLTAPVVSGGWTSQLANVVPRSALPRASAWDAATYNVAGIVGPGCVGLSGFVFAESRSMTIAGVTMLLAVPLTLAVPSAALPPDEAPLDAVAGVRPVASRTRLALRRDLTTGFISLWRSQALRRATVITTVGHTGIGVGFVGITLRADDLGLSVSGGPLLLGVFAAGALLGTFTTGYTRVAKKPDHVVVVGTIGIGIGLLVNSVVESMAFVVATLLLAGWAEGLLFTALLAVRHREAPERHRAQIFTTAASLKIGANALGMAGLVLVTDDGGRLLFVAGALQLVAVLLGVLVTTRAPSQPAPSGRSLEIR
jgi:predicted MFS family arabinose efflux permease